MKIKFNEYLNENKYNRDELLENCNYLKNIYSEYKYVREFFYQIENNFYDKKTTYLPEFGFGFCNETKTSFNPLFKDIASTLIDIDFKINLDKLEKSHISIYYHNRINQFINYLKERPFKKYYYYRTIKKGWDKEKYNVEEKIQYIKDIFEKSILKENFDISINAPVSFINVQLVEK